MRLTILDPGHFHAALVQKHMYADVDATTHVYAPAGPDLDDYLRKIGSYNARENAPTRWRIVTHTGADFLERFVAERNGDMVVIAGNNRRKTEYLMRAVTAGFHTLADKPMVIDAAGFDALGRAFTIAREKGVLLYDIMTERHEITTMLQKEFSTIRNGVRRPAARLPSASGGHQGKRAPFLEAGVRCADQAAGMVLRHRAAGRGTGRHHDASGRPRAMGVLPRPGARLSNGHPNRERPALAHRNHARAVRAGDATRANIPIYLHKDVQADGSLHIYANGEIDYAIRGVHAKISVLWNFEAPAGGGDTHFSVMRGSRANLVIRQGKTQNYQPALYHRAARERRHERLRGCARAGVAREYRRSIRGSTSSERTAVGKSRCRRPITSATKRISARSPSSSCATWRTGRCRRGKFRTCWPSTTRPPRRWRWPSPDSSREVHRGAVGGSPLRRAPRDTATRGRRRE